MPLMRTTFITQLGRYSFSESWYRTASTPDPLVELGAAKEYAVARSQLLGADAYIYAIRISNVDDKRQKTYLAYVNYPGYKGVGLNAPVRGSAAPNVALNMVFQNLDNTQQKLIQLRGIWDDAETTGGTWVFNDPVYTPLIQAFGAKVQAAKYGWLYQSIRREAAIQSIAQAANGIITINFGPASGGGGVATMFTATEAADGANVQIRLSEMVDSENLNGQLTVTVLTPNTCASTKPIAMRPFVTSGKGSRSVKAFTQAGVGRIQRIGNRQAGAPLLLSPGRGRVRSRG